jgi:hypothetical protein
MKSGFKDPISIKKQDPKDRPEDGKNSPWDFRCPQYDQRSSCFVNAGTHYGVGHAQPVGHMGNPSSMAGTLPMDRRSVKTMKCDEVG